MTEEQQKAILSVNPLIRKQRNNVKCTINLLSELQDTVWTPTLLPSTSLDQSKPGGSPEHGHSIYEHSRPSSANQVAGMDRSQPGLYVYVEHLLEQ